MSTSNDDERVAELLADLEIRRLVFEYAASVDVRDWSRLRGLFAEDAVVDYHNGRTVVRGVEPIVDYVDQNTRHLAWQHHQISPYAVSVDGDTASGLAYLTSYQVATEAPTTVLTMVAYYQLAFVRNERSWQFARMVHNIRMSNFAPLNSSPPRDADIPTAVQP